MIPAVSFVSGAGGTGKTTLMRYLCETRKDLSILHMDDLPPSGSIIEGHWYLFPSQTRRYYEELGTANEVEDFNRGVEARSDFQSRLMNRYLKDLHRMLSLVPENGGNLLMERSFVDHMAYHANTINSVGDRTAWHLCMTAWVPTALNIAMSVIPRLNQFRTKHLHTPYPPFWGTESGEDGFRHTDESKNTEWDLLIRQFTDALGLSTKTLDLNDYAACARAVFQIVEPLPLMAQGA